MMKWIKFEAVTTDGIVTRRDTVKNGVLRNTLCSCDGKYKTKKTAKRVLYDGGDYCYCEECGKKFKVLDTYEAEKERLQKQKEERNRKALENLHLFPAWNDWESYGQFYMLSARVDFDTWKSIKKYFHYFTKRELEESEMESFDFIKGWATRQPYEVERILVSKGLIKEENRLDNVLERMENERKERERLAEQKRLERIAEEKRMKEIKDKLQSFFDGDVVSLSDAEASHYLGRLGKIVFSDGVNRFCIDDGYLIQSSDMGDFNFAVKVLLNEEIENFVSSL